MTISTNWKRTEIKKGTIKDLNVIIQQMEFILGATNTGLDIIDSEFNIRYINTEWAKKYGDPSGKKCYEFFKGRKEVCPECGIPKALETKSPVFTEGRLVQEGNRPVQITTIPFQNRDGEWLVAEVNVDITQQKRIEEELRKTKEELEIQIEERVAELLQTNKALQTEIHERKRAEANLQNIQMLLLDVMDMAHIAYWGFDVNTQEFIFNDAFYALYGTTAEKEGGYRMLWKEYADRFFYPEDMPLYLQIRDQLINSTEQDQLIYAEHRIIRRDGEIRHIAARIRIFRDASGNILRFIGANQDITELKRVEASLKKNEEITERMARENAIMAKIGQIISSTLNINEVYEQFAEEAQKLIPFDQISIVVINYKENTFRIAYVHGIEIQGWNKDDVIPLTDLFYELQSKRSGILIQTENRDEMARQYPILLNAFQAGIQSMILTPLISRDRIIGTLLLFSKKPNAYSEEDLRLAERIGQQIAGAIANAQLFAEHERSEEQMNQLQEQLRQSQKMEAIGRLAGGIAHDFNNLMTIIKGYSQLSLYEIKENDPLRENIREIQMATDRASSLTQQLLAFSRRQILEPKVLDLNSTLRDLDKMLRRIIGEDIEMVLYLADDLWKVKIDPGQLEQVILNLAVNAKDAMPAGGKFIIETTNVEIDFEYTQTHIGITPGQYVLLAITDTGVGMSQEVLEKAFEPFYTTKERGTGLGLSTVYGILTQSGGNIFAYSEPNLGTTFKIYLPRVEEEVDILNRKEETDVLSGGNETILLVEDDLSVQHLTCRILQQHGYHIIVASNGEEALQRIKENPEEKIDLLFTDVVMPQMNGKELADQIKSLHPNIKVLYTSGYTDNAIVHLGVLIPGTNILQKPFSPRSLLRKVREVLDKGMR